MTMARPPTSFANFFKPKQNRILLAFRSLHCFQLITFLLLLGPPATAQESKTVLVLYGNTAELPWIKIFDASLRTAVTRRDQPSRRVLH